MDKRSKVWIAGMITLDKDLVRDILERALSCKIEFFAGMWGEIIAEMTLEFLIGEDELKEQITNGFGDIIDKLTEDGWEIIRISVSKENGDIIVKIILEKEFE